MVHLLVLLGGFAVTFRAADEGRPTVFSANSSAEVRSEQRASQTGNSSAGELKVLLALQKQRRDWKSALTTCQRLIEVERRLHGVDSWEPAVANEEAAFLQQLLELPKEKRAQLIEALRLETEAQQISTLLGDPTGAEQVRLKSLQLKQGVLGELHLEVAKTLLLLSQTPDTSKALSYAVRAIEMYEKLCPQGKNPHGHPSLARAYNFVGRRLDGQGRFPEALQFYEKAYAMGRRLYPEKRYPNGHIEMASFISNMGFVHDLMDRIEDGREFHLEALEMRRKLFPPERYPLGHADLAITLNNLGWSHSRTGQPSKALDFYRQALEMRKLIYPKGHYYIAESLSNVGTALDDNGEYERAIEHYSEALEMNRRIYPKKQYPKGHSNIVIRLNNLGYIYRNLGELEKAQTFYQDALKMCESLYPEADFPNSHPNVIRALVHLGGIYGDEKKPKLALEHLEKALEAARRLFNEKEYPEGHFQIAFCLNNLGYHYLDQKEYEQALPLFVRAREMLEKLYPKERDSDPVLSSALSNEAMMLTYLGRFDAAEEAYARVLKIAEHRYPKDAYPQGHPDLALALTASSILWQVQGDFSRSMGMIEQARKHYKQAFKLLDRAASIEYNFGVAFLPDASEALALNFISRNLRPPNALLSISRYLERTDSAAYEQVWRRRGLVFRQVARRHRALQSNTTPKVRSLYHDYLETRQLLANLALMPLDANPERAQTQRERLEKLGVRKESLEKQLTDALPGFRKELRSPVPRHSELAKQLATGTAFVDFLEYVHIEYDESGPSWTPAYAAFVLQPDKPAVRVDLGPVERIDRAIGAWRDEIEKTKPQRSGQEFRNLVWAPISSQLSEPIKSIVVCPDGGLAAVPWGAIPGARSRTILLESFSFTSVPNGQFLLNQLDRSASRSGGPKVLLAVGGVAYDAKPIESSTAGRRAAPVSGDTPTRWGYLKGSEREVDQLGSIARGVQLSKIIGAEASVARIVQELAKAQYAHIATHAYFADAGFNTVLRQDSESATHKQFESTGARASLSSRNPLLLSGLVLAGANLERTERDGVGGSNGILTAEAIASLPLDHLELAVLSACETGLGELAGGEGVYGLQRAFHQAGTETVVASLWKVKDSATQALMAEFYRNLLQKKLSKREALRQAQLAMYRGHLKIPRGDDRRSGGIRVNARGGVRRVPQLWAGWILSGDWK